MIVNTDTGCKLAREREVQEFLASTAASDADRFDALLSFGREAESLFVFLDTYTHRFTGRPKGACD